MPKIFHRLSLSLLTLVILLSLVMIAGLLPALSQPKNSNLILSTTSTPQNESSKEEEDSSTENNNNDNDTFLQNIAITDPSLEIQLIYRGLDSPTQMAFLDANDILVLQKNDGKVLRIKDCSITPEPALVVDVDDELERGLLGIALSKNGEETVYAFVYYTLAQLLEDDDNDDNNNDNSTATSSSISNRLYRYEFSDGKLVNPKLFFKVDASQGASHNGGVVTVGPDGNVYLTIGDVAGHTTLTQNIRNTTKTDGTSTIIRFNQEGGSAGPILGINEPVNKFYAYGIRNSYGLDFDPMTEKLWMTENGPENNDEINLVEPGFNSGWAKISGYRSAVPDFDPKTDLIGCLHCQDTETPFVDFSRLLNKYLFGMKDGQYSDPEFVWKIPVGATAIKFLNSDKLGKNYENDMFVADVILGNIYHFELDERRTGLVVDGKLADGVADNLEELAPITFARGFGGITDLEVGPDGYLYILSYEGYETSIREEAIYRVVPKGTPLPC